MPLPVNLQILDDGEAVETIRFGPSRPGEKIQKSYTLRNSGLVPAWNILFKFGKYQPEQQPVPKNAGEVFNEPSRLGEIFVEQPLGVSVDVSPMALEAGEENPLILSWTSDRLLIGSDVLMVDLRVSYDYANAVV
jgi:hypothetical protein